MELSQLEQFIAIAKNQTMTKAAQQLHISLLNYTREEVKNEMNITLQTY